MPQNLLIENGKITLPKEVIGRYQLNEATPVRIIETRGGILLVPLSDSPMDSSLSQEISDWQALGAEAFESFPYEGED